MRPDGLAAIRFWIRVEQDRKSPWRLARAFGPSTLLLFLARRLTLAAAMRRVSRIVGTQAEAVSMPFAEAAMDVDKPADLVIAEEILRNGPPARSEEHTSELTSLMRLSFAVFCLKT